MPPRHSALPGSRILGSLLWQLRYDLLAVAVVAAAMAALSAVVPLQGVASVVPLLGIVVSIFIGFRNSNAFNRWWEARTLWSTVTANCHAIPIPRYYATFVRALTWFFAIMVCTRVDVGGHHSAQGLLIGAAVMALFVVAERMGHLAEGALGNSPFALPMNQYCSAITADLLGTDHPLAEPNTSGIEPNHVEP